MQLLGSVPLDKLTPSRVWSELDPETRVIAAQSLYASSDNARNREEANLAIAAALRFRIQAVRKLPVEKRVEYLTRAVRPDDSLASTLLTAFHLSHRVEMLASFLDSLEIPQHDGIIDEEFQLDSIDPEKLDAAVGQLRRGFPADDVEIYLATLVSMDPEFWHRLSEVPVPGPG